MAIASPCAATSQKLRGSATIAISTSSLLLAVAYMTSRSLYQRQHVISEKTRKLVENNLPLSQFELSSFRNIIQLASVEAERALWASYNSVLRYVIRLYNYLLPKVITTKGGKRGYLGIVAYYVDSSGELRDLPIALLQLTGAHTSEAMAKVVIAIFKQFEITVGKLGYFVLNNAHNNNTTINTLALQIGFSATKRRLRCGPYTLNLIS
ncbi:hypothetical protein PtrM4_091970 [Pyrenophora tritici-repentis]|uniref:Uncharacterized protein n=1 Tax=Pyrenophora tritici-repentis TaxID=45151 RepID=A0A834S140_9PLEO|nr:hypothetical protein PtrM4_051820 [Pyrenophora tritici-repentis]KAF7570518.1 hypothetical protein PtrM4_105200 [Pyrenophora tritici-repentis]KAF7571697.1 hypothetical protein PtrM4_091970 [Pyrenophora tritici-repentis]